MIKQAIGGKTKYIYSMFHVPILTTAIWNWVVTHFIHNRTSNNAGVLPWKITEILPHLSILSLELCGFLSSSCLPKHTHTYTQTANIYLGFLKSLCELIDLKKYCTKWTQFWILLHEHFAVPCARLIFCATHCWPWGYEDEQQGSWVFSSRTENDGEIGS